MKKVYRYKFNTVIIVLFVVSALIAIAGIVYSTLRLFGVLDQVSIFPVVDISAIVVCALILIAMLFLFFGTNYTFEEDGFSLRMFFFKKKIPAEALNYVIEDKESKLIFLYFVTDPEKGAFEFLPITIDKSKSESFFKDVKKFYPTVIIDEFKSDT